MDFSVPDGIMSEALELLARSREKGKIRIGVNEVTKAVEREVAKLVLVAEDVEPKEIVMHIPLICDEKKIPYCPVKTKKELGEKAGIGVGTSSVAITDAGTAKKELGELEKKLFELKSAVKPAAKKEAKPSEEKPAEKKEAKTEKPKAEKKEAKAEKPAEAKAPKPEAAEAEEKEAKPEKPAEAKAEEKE